MKSNKSKGSKNKESKNSVDTYELFETDINACISAIIKYTRKGLIKWAKQENIRNITYLGNVNGIKRTIRFVKLLKPAQGIYSLYREYSECPSDGNGRLLEKCINDSHPEIKAGDLNKKKLSKYTSISKVMSRCTNAKEIKYKDFLIRSNVFKCINREHHIENITAVVKIIRGQDDYFIDIPAGYCRQCDKYYVIQSSVEKLRKYGIPGCRICDENQYSRNYTSNGMLLNEQSILMEYGYSVSKGDDLSEMVRRKILANLVDNDVIGKIAIISYLDFFINSHSDSRYEEAISKWEDDREFISEYKKGQYATYGALMLRKSS